jgi:hypothetical protein
VAINPEMRQRVEQLLGPDHFRVLTSAPTARGNGNGNGNGRRRAGRNGH